MWAGLGALVIKWTLAFFVVWVFSFHIAIIEHVDAYEVGHLIIHFFTIAKLECEILVLLLLMGVLGVLLQVV
jgi:hypothetical protein